MRSIAPEPGGNSSLPAMAVTPATPACGQRREALFSHRRLAELAKLARPIASELLFDQGFLNFCLDHTDTEVHNLHDFVMPHVIWAGVPGYRRREGRLIDQAGNPVGMVHWAGFSLDGELPYAGLWRHWFDAAAQP